jgi:hypothetical protein
MLRYPWLELRGGLHELGPHKDGKLHWMTVDDFPSLVLQIHQHTPAFMSNATTVRAVALETSKHSGQWLIV